MQPLKHATWQTSADMLIYAIDRPATSSDGVSRWLAATTTGTPWGRRRSLQRVGPVR